MRMRTVAAAACRILAALSLVTAAGARAAADEEAELRSLWEERASLEAKLEVLRRRLPPESEARNARTMLRRATETAVRVDDVELAPGSEVVPLDDGRPSTLRALRLEVAGRGTPFDLETFLTRVGILDYWLRDLESLEAEGEGGEELAFRARFVFLVEARPEEPAPARPLDLQQVRAKVAELGARVRLVEAWSARTDDGRLHEAAALLDAFSEPLPARFTSLRVDERIALEGVTVGAAARAGLLAGLEQAGFAVTRLETPAGGACRPFALAAVRGARERAMETVAGPAGERAAALCADTGAPVPSRIEARGVEGGELALRLRDVDIPHVFFVLHELTGAGFVVDGDVGGRVDVEIASATLEEILAALSASGLVIGEPPLRRVSRATVEPLAGEFTGEPVSLSFQDADLVDLLCVFEEITSLEIRVPPGLDARATIHVSDLPWDHAIEALIASARLGSAVDGTQVFVGPPAEVASGRRTLWSDACRVRAPAKGSPVAGLRPPPAELGATDLTLAGVGSGRDGHRGYAYGAWRRMVRLAPGDRLFDAQVKAVAPEGVTLALDGGGELRLEPAR